MKIIPYQNERISKTEQRYFLWNSCWRRVRRRERTVADCTGIISDGVRLKLVPRTLRNVVRFIYVKRNSRGNQRNQFCFYLLCHCMQRGPKALPPPARPPPLAPFRPFAPLRAPIRRRSFAFRKQPFLILHAHNENFIVLFG